MKSVHSSRLLSFLGSLIPLDLSALNIMAGLRAAFACAVPVLFAELSGNDRISWIAIAGFWTSLSDTGGAWTDRLKAMSVFTVLATAGCFIGTLVEPYPAAAVSFCFLWCFATSFARIYGNAASTVGLLLSSAVLVTLGLPVGGLDEAANFASLTLIGGGWGMLLSLVFWRLQPYAPARKAVAACWIALSDYAMALSHLHRGSTHDADAWSRLASARRRALREAIEYAGVVSVATRRTRAGATAEGQRLLAVLADGDQVSAALIGLNEVLEAASAASADLGVRRAVRAILGHVSARAREVAHRLDGAAPKRARNITPLIAGLQRRISLSHARRHHAYSAELLQQVSLWIDAAFENFDAPRTSKTHLSSMLEQAVSRRLSVSDLLLAARANLGFTSITFRHALRLAATAALAVSAARLFDISRGYWISITAIVVLQPYMAETWRRSFDRIGGSMLGGLVAAWLLQYVSTPMQMALLIFPLCVFAFALRTVNYALFMLCMTPLVVLIAELFQTGGIGDAHLASLRAIDSLIGGLFGLGASFLLWPSWEKPQLPRLMADAVRAHRDYLDVVLGGNQSANDEDIGAARRQTGLTSNNAEASLQRVLSEGSRASRAAAEPALIALASLRRLGGVIVTLTLLPSFTAGQVNAEKFSSLRHWATAALSDLADSIEEGRQPAALAMSRLPENVAQQGESTNTSVELILEDELMRLHRQLQVLHEAASKLANIASNATTNAVAV